MVTGPMWHYTCDDHGGRSLDAMPVPTVLPMTMSHPKVAATMPQYRMLWAVSWFTDLDTPEEHALGLTRTITMCDRTERRFRVIDDDVPLLVPWPAYRRSHPQTIWRLLEQSGGAMPAHWWVSEKPVRVVAA